MRALAITLLGACGFAGPPVSGIADVTDAMPAVDSPSAVSDGFTPGVCPWNGLTPPTNVQNPCNLAVVVIDASSGTKSINADSIGTEIPQADGTHLRAIRVASLDVIGTLQIGGSEPLAIIVDGPVSIGGTIVTTTTDSGHCGSLEGDGGGGGIIAGGGGGAGGAAGGNGANGGNGHQSATSGGSAHNGMASTLMPLRGGCPGGPGGVDATALIPGGAGGVGGGGLEISALGAIAVSGKIFAEGGGGGGALPYTGGGGGGSGGAIFLESSSVTVSGLLCADGASGGEGGDGTGFATSKTGSAGACTGATAAGTSSTSGSGGGLGGNGSYSAQPDGVAGGSAQSNKLSGGGGGGGGVGWIRINASQSMMTGATVTPTAH